MKNQGKIWIGLSIIGLFLMSFATMNTSQPLDSSAEVHSNLILNYNDPVVTLSGMTYADSEISLEKVKNLTELSLDKAFIKKGFKVESYKVVWVSEGMIQEISGKGSLFNSTALKVFKEFSEGTKFSIEQIKVKAPTGESIKTPAFSFKIK